MITFDPFHTSASGLSGQKGGKHTCWVCPDIDSPQNTESEHASQGSAVSELVRSVERGKGAIQETDREHQVKRVLLTLIEAESEEDWNGQAPNHKVVEDACAGVEVDEQALVAAVTAGDRFVPTKGHRSAAQEGAEDEADGANHGKPHHPIDEFAERGIGKDAQVEEEHRHADREHGRVVDYAFRDHKLREMLVLVWQEIEITYPVYGGDLVRVDVPEMSSIAMVSAYDREDAADDEHELDADSQIRFGWRGVVIVSLPLPEWLPSRPIRQNAAFLS